MLLGKFSKTPDEAKRYSIEYENWLDTNEYLSNVQIQLISVNSDPIAVSKSQLQNNSTQIEFIISGGAKGQTYTLSITATTSLGQIKQDTLMVSVRAL